MPKLTAAYVRSDLQPGRHSDGEGLYLTVSKTGQKSWVFMWKRAGRVREMGLGSATGVGKIGALTLADARDAAQAARRLIVAGTDPITERKKGRGKTFGEVADALIVDLAPSWRNEKHGDQWRMTMKVYAAPIRSKGVDSISTADILGILRPIWQSKPETASRIRGRIEKVLDAAKAQGLRDNENPARWKGHLDHLLPRAKKLSRGHHRAMPYADAPALLERLRSADGMSALALEFTILTVARSGETRGALWSEIDLKAATWSIPAGRMKSGREHVVPLSDRALEILRDLHEGRRGKFIFPGSKGVPLSDMALGAVLKRMNIEATVHGFRSSFRDWAGNETGFARELAEEALAHAIGDAVERAYRRGSALEKRRKLMDAWSAYLAAPAGGNVVQLAGATR